MPRRETSGLLFALCVALATAGCGAQRDALETGGSGVWFDDLVGVLEPSTTAADAVARCLESRAFGESRCLFEDQGDRFPRIVFLSLGDGMALADVSVGAGLGLAAAASDAASAAGIGEMDRPPRYLKIDFVTGVGTPATVERRGSIELERGLEGLAFDHSSGLAFLPEEVLSRTLVTSDGVIREDNIADYARALGGASSSQADQLWSGGLAEVRSFTTRSFFSDGSGLRPLERGHARLHRSSLEEILEAATAAGEYLRRSVTGSGRFVYSYLPKTDRVKDDYNILRHAGAVYSMLELYEITEDRDLLAGAVRALEFLREQIEPCPESGAEATACVVEKGYVKLGGNALALLAICKYAQVTGDRSLLSLARRLGRRMLAIQADNGEFKIHKQHVESGRVDDLVSEYYPGEALFALVRLSDLDGDSVWLDAAEAGAQYLITVRDAGLSDAELSHDHWLLYALDELHRRRPGELYERHALRLAAAIIESQNREPEFSDWRGSYYRPPRSTPTATRSEGLCAAHQLARDGGRAREATAMLEAVRLGVDFQLQTQFRPESALYLEDQQRVLGGFHRSLTDFEIRIDYVQHNISSLLCLLRAEEALRG